VRVLVTGSTGHIGDALCASLRATGHAVVGLSRHDVTQESGDHVTIDIGDRRAVDDLKVAVEPCDAIVHAAASIELDPDASSVAFTNCWGTQALLATARAWAVRRFVYISSIGVVGNPVVLPITEEHPTSPLYAYHASKLFGEHLVAIAALGGIRATSLRITSPVGPGMSRGRILSTFVERALRGEELVLLGRGTRRQNYVDVRDVAGAVVRCLDRGPVGVLNIGGASSLSNLDLASKCIETLGSRSQIRFDGVDAAEGLVWDVSSSRAAETIGYVPEHGIEESIRSVAAEI
jgi:nucleoside-diphosphate-sugar epimerase